MEPEEKSLLRTEIAGKSRYKYKTLAHTLFNTHLKRSVEVGESSKYHPHGRTV